MSAPEEISGKRATKRARGPSSSSEPHCTASDLAGLLNLTPRRVRQLAADGVIPRVAHGRYSLRAAVRAYVEYLQHRHQVHSQESEQTARWRQARAELTELEVAKASGELIPAEDAALAVAQVIGAMGHHNAADARRLAIRLAGMSDAAQVLATLQQEFRNERMAAYEALEQLANAWLAAVEIHSADTSVAVKGNGARRPVSAARR